MAEYCTVPELATFGITVNATRDLSATEKLKPAIEGASQVADSYLAKRYTLPLTAWGKDLSRAVACIAAYDLISSKGYSPSGNLGEEQLRLRYEDAIAWLRDVAKGLAEPQITDSSTGASPGKSSSRPVLAVSSSQRGWSGSGDYPFQGD